MKLMAIYIIILIFEILYYSLFMKYSINKGKLWRYLLLFTIFSAISWFMNDTSPISYMIILLMILYGLKYIVRVKTTLYDLFFIFIMMLMKVLIELILALPTMLILNDIEISKIIMGTMKLSFILIIRKELNPLYLTLRKHWENNRFFIRYIFTILMFLYVIFSCVFLINFR